MTDKLNDITEMLTELTRRERENRLSTYQPYKKQEQFHTLGATVRERFFVAGSQSGKTTAAAYETAAHAVGAYPSWWKGRRFVEKAAKIWIGGQSSGALRDAAQNKLLGTSTPFSTPDAVGTGALPKNSILKLIPTRGVADAVDSILVRHASGGTTTISFRNYEQSQDKWAGGTVDIVWLDEEPPMSIYIEAVARITANPNGIIYTTFTPLNGSTPLVGRFMDEGGKDRAFVRMTLWDVGHMTREQVQAQLERLPPWERDARIEGLPATGHGRLITIPENQYVVEPVKLQSYWPRIIGLDIGLLHPTAAVFIAHDVDRNIAYVYDEYLASDLRISDHASALIMKGAGDICVSWPHDASAREHGSGLSIAAQYKKLGLRMLSQHASDPTFGTSVWGSVTDLLQRLQYGSLKIFNHCSQLRQELREYHQKDGEIVRERDDAISALRYGIMSLRKAKAPDFQHPLARAHRPSQSAIAKDADLDPFFNLK